jgi:hypothetical protein
MASVLAPTAVLAAMRCNAASNAVNPDMLTFALADNWSIGGEYPSRYLTDLSHAADRWGQQLIWVHPFADHRTLSTT